MFLLILVLAALVGLWVVAGIVIRDQPIAYPTNEAKAGAHQVMLAGAPHPCSMGPKTRDLCHTHPPTLG